MTRKAIYNFLKEYHLQDFPALPSYQAFCRRLNRLAGAFAALVEIWMEEKLKRAQKSEMYVLDSCPVMVSTGSRANSAKTAREVCNLTRNPTKNQWYHGVKLHVFALLQPHTLPIPCAIQISKASLCDLWAAKQIDMDIAPVQNGQLYADRAYIDGAILDYDIIEWEVFVFTVMCLAALTAESASIWSQRNTDLITPRKKKKYDTLISADAASTFVSGIRQPIEIYFNWLNAKTNIQYASHVRSLAGLLLHIYSSLAFAMFSQLFNY